MPIIIMLVSKSTPLLLIKCQCTNYSSQSFHNFSHRKSHGESQRYFRKCINALQRWRKGVEKLDLKYARRQHYLVTLLPKILQRNEILDMSFLELSVHDYLVGRLQVSLALYEILPTVYLAFKAKYNYIILMLIVVGILVIQMTDFSVDGKRRQEKC